MSEAAETESLIFTGSIAALQSAITFGVDGGARVKIDIPQSDRLAAATLIELQGCELEFTIRVKPSSDKQSETELNHGAKSRNVSSREQRKSERTPAKAPGVD